MALGTPSESPAVVVREIDLTGGVPNVQSTTGAIIGSFDWGPVNERVAISNETELAETFGSPSRSEAVIDFLSATQFLRYSSSLQVVRAINDSAYTAFSMNVGGLSVDSASEFDSFATIGSANNIKILNKSNFDARQSTLESDSAQDSNGNSSKLGFAARFPGAPGNSLLVSYIAAQKDSADTLNIVGTNFDSWTYKGSFDAHPSTTIYGTNNNITGDAIHVAVVDVDGTISGSRGTVLETYPNLSIKVNAKDDFGTSLYVKDVINERSEYVYLLNLDSDLNTLASVDSTYVAAVGTSAQEFRLRSGSKTGSLTTGQIDSAYGLFADKDQVEVDFLISPSMLTRTNQTTVVNRLVSYANARKDCVVVASPARNDIVNVTSDADKVSNAVATADTFTRSSYLIADNNFLKVYDKYNDQFEFIPAASTVAGIMAATDINRAAWFSPAGSRRGQLLGITGLSYSPTKAQRDTLYKAGINPIANIPGQGALLFGDKTFLGRVSAFDRINVRRLFLILERAIGRAAEQVLFEFNDEFTRAEFVNIVEPVLREVQGRRGITDFRVVCDETNNTAAVIDRNEFKADIFIKPARSINYVTLSFVAVRTGVDFEEVVGTV